jgi:hypothetical protein
MVMVLSIIRIESIPGPVRIVEVVVYHTRIVPWITPAAVVTHSPTPGIKACIPTPRAVCIRTTPLVPTVPTIPAAPTAVRPVIIHPNNVDRRSG